MTPSDSDRLDRIERMLLPLVGLENEPPVVVRLDRIERVLKVGVWLAGIVVVGIVGLLLDRLSDRVAPVVRYVEVVPKEPGK